MKSFTNVNPRSLKDAVQALGKNPNAAIVGGGSDLLGMVKERLIEPEALVNLKAIPGLAQVREQNGGLRIGGLTTLAAMSEHPLIRSQYQVLADAAHAVGTPQIRNAGTLAGNVCQRPWCWYYRNSFPCYKNGGNTCFSITGENEFHAIFGGGPSFIVHPSDTAPALVALEAQFRIVGPKAERMLHAADFFALPRTNPARENVLANDEILAEVVLPASTKGLKSTYHKELDRESWTHAIVSAAVALDMAGETCKRARIVLGGVAPVPWRLQKVEAMLEGQKITPELAARAGEAAIEGAQPLAKNRYKLPITKAVVKRTVLGLVHPA